MLKSPSTSLWVYYSTSHCTCVLTKLYEATLGLEECRWHHHVCSSASWLWREKKTWAEAFKDSDLKLMSGLRSEMIKMNVQVFAAEIWHIVSWVVCIMITFLFWGGKIFRASVGIFKKAPCKTAEGRRKKRKRAAVTVRPLPVVTSRGCGGFKRRQPLLLPLHPLLGQTEDTCEAPDSRHLKQRRKKVKVEVKYDGGPTSI